MTVHLGGGARRGIGRRGGGGVSYAAETVSYLAAMSVQPSASRATAINTLVTSLKTQSLWTKLDFLYLHAAHDEQTARVDLKLPSRVATRVGSPAWTADVGYGPLDGTNNVNLGFNPTTAGGGYALNSAHIGTWLTQTRNGNQTDLFAGNALMYAFYNGIFYAKLNSTVQPTYTVGSSTLPWSIGHRALSRTDGTNLTYYIDGANVSVAAAAANSLPNANFVMNTLGKNAISHGGSGLSDAEMLALRNTLGQYLNDALILPKYDVFLIIGDSNNHNGATYDATIDVSSSRVHKFTEAVLPTVAVEPVVTAGVVGYPLAFLRDFFIPGGALPADRTALVIWASGGGTGLFTAGQEWRSPSGTSYLPAVRLATRALSGYPNARFRGILGCEGANDATASADATLFQTQYDAMLTGLRTDIPGSSAVPIVMAGIPESYLAAGTATALQAKISSMPSRFAHAAYADNVSPTSLMNPSRSDIHYNAVEQRGTLGAPGGMAGRFWTAWQALT